MSALSDYAMRYAEITGSKPPDGAIENQTCLVNIDGSVSVQFQSRETEKIQQLIDWLNSLIRTNS